MFEAFDIEIKSSQFIYAISNKLEIIGNIQKRKIIIYDQKVEKYCKKLFRGEKFFISLTIEEERKNLDSVKEILLSLGELGATKDDELIAVGGGALQDLVTLAASIYMRGVHWHYVPTTLMSMLDSCIGGKSSINLGDFKNIVGNFYPPKSIYIDINFLETLTKIDIASGMAEGVKICFASSSAISDDFQKLSHSWGETKESIKISQAIELSLRTKKWFVEIDEFDKKERKLLNFGHTFGHALESSTNYTVPHGIGVFIGMYAAVLRSEVVHPTKNLLNYIRSEISQISKELPKITLNKNTFNSAIKRDKKNSVSHQILILPNKNGNLVEVKFELNDENLNLCYKSMIQALDELGLAHEIL